MEEIPGLDAYLAEFTSVRALGPEGYMMKGLMALNQEERQAMGQRVENLEPLP